MFRLLIRAVLVGILGNLLWTDTACAVSYFYTELHIEQTFKLQVCEVEAAVEELVDQPEECRDEEENHTID